MASIVCILYLNVYLMYTPYIDDMDDIFAYYTHLILTFIFLIACYTRFSERLVEALQLSAEEKLDEVFAFDSLINISSVLGISVGVIGVMSAIWDIRDLWINGSKIRWTYEVNDKILINDPKHEGEWNVDSAQWIVQSSKFASYNLSNEQG